jgi:serine protease
MRRVLIRAGIVAASLLAPFALNAPLAQVSAASASAPPARVIVKFRASSPVLRMQAQAALSQHAVQAQALGQRIGIALTAGRPMSERSQVVFASGMTSRQLAARIGVESDIEYAVADEKKHIVAAPNDPFYATRAVTASAGGPSVGQWYLKPPGPAGSGNVAGTAPAAINAEQAWDITTGSASIVVADLDTGIRFDHPDLQGNVIPGYDMVSPDDGASGTNFSSANDGNARDSDASDPGDGITQADKANPVFAGADCTVGNSSWHGTQTAGLIAAATNNGVGIASVGRTVRLMPVRVLGKCGGYDSDISVGMLWAAGVLSAAELSAMKLPANPTPARVLNMSLGGSQACSQAYIDAIGRVNAAGVVVVAAAGNSGGNAVGSPASCPGALGVTALRHVGDKVGFSDLGPQITIAAPGGNCVTTGGGACLYPIMTTSNSGAIKPDPGVAGAIYTDSFNTTIGTSFSAPLVSGTVALMLSAQPSLTAAQVKSTLQATARPFPTTGGTAGTSTCSAPGTAAQDECYCTTTTCGAGMLDAHAALLAVNGVQAAISLTTTTPTAGLTVALTSSSVETSGHTVATYEWTILNAGSSGAVITSAANAASVTVAAPNAGTFLIQLTTTDNNGYTSSATLSVVVVAPVVVTPPAAVPPATSSGGGGGALGVAWLLLLLTAVLALAATERRERSAPARFSAAGRTSRTG